MYQLPFLFCQYRKVHQTSEFVFFDVSRNLYHPSTLHFWEIRESEGKTLFTEFARHFLYVVHNIVWLSISNICFLDILFEYVLYLFSIIGMLNQFENNSKHNEYAFIKPHTWTLFTFLFILWYFIMYQFQNFIVLIHLF